MQDIALVLGEVLEAALVLGRTLLLLLGGLLLCVCVCVCVCTRICACHMYICEYTYIYAYVHIDTYM